MQKMRFSYFAWLPLILIAVLLFSAYGRAWTNGDDKKAINAGGQSPNLVISLKVFVRGNEIYKVVASDSGAIRKPFSEGALIRLNIEEDRTGDPADIVAMDDIYYVDVSSEDATPPTLAVYQGPPVQAEPIQGGKTDKTHKTYWLTINISLDEPGQKYAVKIVRYKSLDEKLSGEKGRVIYEDSFKTYHKYYLGLNAGLLLPAHAPFKSYSLYYDDPTDASDQAKRTLKETKYWQAKAIIFASWYPGGFEPERAGHIQINAGTEISSSIFENFYFGAGYATKYYSLNFFVGWFTEKALPESYTKLVGKDVPNKNIDEIPFQDKRDNFIWGISLAAPINIAAMIGKLIGL